MFELYASDALILTLMLDRLCTGEPYMSSVPVVSSNVIEQEGLTVEGTVAVKPQYFVPTKVEPLYVSAYIVPDPLVLVGIRFIKDRGMVQVVPVVTPVAMVPVCDPKA